MACSIMDHGEGDYRMNEDDIKYLKLLQECEQTKRIAKLTLVRSVQDKEEMKETLKESEKVLQRYDNWKQEFGNTMNDLLRTLY